MLFLPILGLCITVILSGTMYSPQFVDLHRSPVALIQAVSRTSFDSVKTMLGGIIKQHFFGIDSACVSSVPSVRPLALPPVPFVYYSTCPCPWIVSEKISSNSSIGGETPLHWNAMHSLIRSDPVRSSTRNLKVFVMSAVVFLSSFYAFKWFRINYQITIKKRSPPEMTEIVSSKVFLPDSIMKGLTNLDASKIIETSCSEGKLNISLDILKLLLHNQVSLEPRLVSVKRWTVKINVTSRQRQQDSALSTPKPLGVTNHQVEKSLQANPFPMKDPFDGPIMHNEIVMSSSVPIPSIVVTDWQVEDPFEGDSLPSRDPFDGSIINSQTFVRDQAEAINRAWKSEQQVETGAVDQAASATRSDAAGTTENAGLDTSHNPSDSSAAESETAKGPSDNSQLADDAEAEERQNEVQQVQQEQQAQQEAEQTDPSQTSAEPKPDPSAKPRGQTAGIFGGYQKPNGRWQIDLRATASWPRLKRKVRRRRKGQAQKLREAREAEAEGAEEEEEGREIEGQQVPVGQPEVEEEVQKNGQVEETKQVEHAQTTTTTTERKAESSAKGKGKGKSKDAPAAAFGGFQNPNGLWQIDSASVVPASKPRKRRRRRQKKGQGLRQREKKKELRAALEAGGQRARQAGEADETDEADAGEESA